MTQLRQRMIEDLQLRGFAPKTQEANLRAVRQVGRTLRQIAHGHHRG